MNSANTRDSVVAAFFALVVIGALAVWKFSQLFGLDFSTGFDILKGLLVAAIAWAGIWYLLPFSFRDVTGGLKVPPLWRLENAFSSASCFSS